MIQIQDVTFSYKKELYLFKDLSLSLELGKIYGLLGKNGAGKSTLLKIVNGLLYPQKGTCTFADIACAERHPAVLSNIFYIPEEFELPAINMDAFVKYNAPFYPSFSIEQYETYLQEFEMKCNKKLHKLSFGQKKKFLIAFGIATNTQVLILDEPTNGLDIPSKSQFRKIMASSVDESKMILISTHQVRDLSQLIDHIIVLENGTVLFSQNTGDISDKLSFGHVKNTNEKEVFYSEPVLGGHSAIYRKGQQETDIDIELLFNAIVTNHTVINEALLK